MISTNIYSSYIINKNVVLYIKSFIKQIPQYFMGYFNFCLTPIPFNSER